MRSEVLVSSTSTENGARRGRVGVQQRYGRVHTVLAQGDKMPSQRPRDAADSIHCHVGQPRLKACTAMIQPGSAHASQIVSYISRVYTIPYFI